MKENFKIFLVNFLKCNDFQEMAAIFCLFSVAMCKLANSNYSHDSLDYMNVNYRMAPRIDTMPLSANYDDTFERNFIPQDRKYISPCPGFFRYTNIENEWFGLMALPSSKLGVTMSVDIRLTVLAQLPTVSSQFHSSPYPFLFNDNVFFLSKKLL
jgi:hypothetical protein